MTILFVVDNLRMLLICPDRKKLHECHVGPMFMMPDTGMGWTHSIKIMLALLKLAAQLPQEVGPGREPPDGEIPDGV